MGGEIVRKQIKILTVVLTFLAVINLNVSLFQDDSLNFLSDGISLWNGSIAYAKNVVKESVNENVSSPIYVVNEDNTLSMLTNKGKKSIPKKRFKKVGFNLDTNIRGKELIEKRDAYTRHFLNADGTITAQVSDIPIHYKEGNKYSDIDLSIVPQKGGEFEYICNKNSFTAYFSGNKNVNDFKLARFEFKNSKGISRWIDYKLLGAKPDKKILEENSIKYKDILKNVDLEYEIDPTKLKENIIINAPVSNFTYTFLLDTEGVNLKASIDGGIDFIDVDTGEKLWGLIPPYAKDSADEEKTTHNVRYNLGKTVYEGKEYNSVTLVVNDNKFLSNATYPIIIDPTTTLYRSYGRFISSEGMATFDSIDGYGWTGFPESIYSREYRLYLNFDLSTIPSNATINSAKLTIDPSGVTGSNPNGGGYFVVKRLTSDPYNATWYNKPSASQNNQVSIYTSGTSIKEWNITAMMQEIWTNRYPFYGVSVESYPPNNYVFFYYLYYPEYKCPTLTLTYSTNQPPSITSPSPNGTKYNGSSSVTPQMYVSDPDGNTLDCKYYIDSVLKETRNGITNTVNPQLVAFSSINTSTLSEGNHTLTFEVSDRTAPAVQSSTTITVDKTAPSIGTVTATSTDTGITVTGSATDSLPNSTPYRYSVTATGYSVVSPWTSSTSYTTPPGSPLTPNTVYSVKFEAQDFVGNTANKTQNVYTKAQIPSLKITNPTTTSLDLSTTDNNPVQTYYQITAGTQYVSSTGTLVSSPTWIQLTGKKITMTGLLPNTSYGFKAKAKNDNNEETSLSGQVNGLTLPDPPGNINAVPARDSITVTWGAVNGATGYEIKADSALVNNGTNTSYKHSGLNPDTQHTYTIRVTNASGTSAWSTPLTVSTLPNPPAAPVNITAVPEITNITLSWDPVVYASGYEIEADGSIITGIGATSYEHSGLDAGTEHKYRIRAKNAGGESPWSDYITVSTLPNPPKTPGNITAAAEIGKITITWDPADRAAGYDIEADNVLHDNGTATTYEHTGLGAETQHKYRVKARNAGGESPWSEYITVSTLPNPPGVPTNVTAIADSKAITLTWDAMPGATGYDILADGTAISNIAGTMYTHAGLTPGTQHKYSIRAKNAGGASEWSAETAIMTLSEQNTSVTNVVAVITDSSVTIGWDALEGATGYIVEADGVISDNDKNTMYYHSGLTPSTKHTYKVKAKNTSGEGEWCTVLTVTTLPKIPNAPANIKASVSGTAIAVSWDEVTGGTGYEIEVDGVVKDNGTGTAFTHDGLIPGTQHTYRVRARNESGTTGWSSVLVKSTANPEYTVGCTAGKELSISLVASNIQDFTGRKFSLTYNADELELLDLSGFTPQTDLNPDGKIPETNITVSYIPGKIVFTVNNPVLSGKSWSGVVNTVIFKAKISGKTGLTYIVE